MNIMMEGEIVEEHNRHMKPRHIFTGRVRVRVTTKFGTMLFDRMFETKAEAQAAYDAACAIDESLGD